MDDKRPGGAIAINSQYSCRSLSYLFEWYLMFPLFSDRFRASSPKGESKVNLKERMINKTDTNQETAMHCVRV